ncbi:hypothetical protein J31TS4_44870 [Paenibacillus sp. J31TS4]|uniref:DUF4091 domain-containing protein n=1 Tax=Paenibacillus sp. J31TS4 TaxID=2807195 RepID=UPI001B21B4E3|nr:DUF4091 domain-containing protein [Paenibacillus sp. J31TS4]GIP41207.1 hypothetical protein J31TS4_44870 [Paenibacillus sp. J31TS4]
MSMRTFMRMQRSTLLVLLSAVMLWTIGAPAYAKTDPLFQVWVPTNTEKVLRDQPFPSAPNAKLELGAARNEYESGQVIVKADGGALRKLQVSISELKQEGGPAKLDSGNIELFRQHYIEVTTSTTPTYPKGWYPDALVPLEGMLEVEAGHNQGIWIKVHVPKGQPAGLYKGELTLHETGNPVRIPVEMTVWDFELSDESHAKTAFSVWGGPIQEVHGGVVGEEAWQYIEKYYWASVEHRLTPGYLPIPDSDIDQYVERAPKYINDPRVSAFRLPYYRTAQGEPDVARMKELVDKLRVRGLLAKGYYYVSEIDEPAQDKYGRVKVINAALEQAAPDVPHLVTVQPVDELTGHVDIWTPEIDKFDPEYAHARQEAGDHVWWYTCVTPKHPFPSYHLDDDLVGTRLLAWMQRDYGVEGTLYWATTQFQKYDSVQKKYVSRDVWTDPLAFPGANGDGYLFYPGTEVGIDGPVGTIRLEVLRESMEDYEYLYQYEQLLRSKAEALGIAETFPYRDAVRPFYDRLYKAVRSFEENPDNVLQVRKEIAEELTAGKNAGPSLVTVGKPADGVREMTVFAPKGAQASLNGQPMTLAGGEAGYDRFSMTLELGHGVHNADIVVTHAGGTQTINRVLAVQETSAPYSIELNNVETAQAVKRFTTSTVDLSLTEEHVTQGEHAMKAVFRANVNFPNLRLFEAGKGFRSADWSSFRNLEFDVYNPGKDVTFYVKFHQTNGKTDDTFLQTIRGGTSKTIRIPLEQVSLDRTQIKGIEIWMWKQTVPQTLYFDHFRFTSAAPADSMAP